MPITIGTYRILRELGRGGMGKVYLAKDPASGELRAIKVLRRDLLEWPNVLARFRREIEISRGLSHPNICQLYHAETAGRRPYLEMEYIVGDDLLQSAGVPPVGQAVDWICQAAAGLAYAHACEVVHRDVKPRNLMVDARGTVKVLDFGLARLAVPGGTITAAESYLGSLGFISPDQFRNPSRATPAFDIYSLGATLFTVLTGKRLYEVELAAAGRDYNLCQSVTAAYQCPLPSLQSVRGDVPEKLDEVFRSMVAPEPEDRLRSMDEVIELLEPFADRAPSRGLPRSERATVDIETTITGRVRAAT